MLRQIKDERRHIITRLERSSLGKIEDSILKSILNNRRFPVAYYRGSSQQHSNMCVIQHMENVQWQAHLWIEKDLRDPIIHSSSVLVSIGKIHPLVTGLAVDKTTPPWMAEYNTGMQRMRLMA